MSYFNLREKISHWFSYVGIAFLLLSFCSCSQKEKPPFSKKISLEERMDKIEAALPGVGEIMNQVQLHFAKLYFAAQAKNWALADFELDELEENLQAAVSLRPEERGVRLGGVFEAFKSTELKQMRESLASKNMEDFNRSYKNSLMVCNSCHTATGRPFIVITLPSGPPVTNQMWKPPSLQK